MRRTLALLVLMLALVALDLGQQSVYIRCAPTPHDRGDWGAPGTAVRALLVAGEGLDAAERATGRRDLVGVETSLFSRYGEQLRTRNYFPGDATPRRISPRL